MIGAVVLAVAVILLVLSNRTDRERAEEGHRMLAQIETVNARLDAAILALRSGQHTDFDLVTDLARELAALTESLSAPGAEPLSGSLAPPIAQKNALVEDFKAQQAAVRNSITIAEELLVELSAQADTRNAIRLFQIERELLRYIASGEYRAGLVLATAMENAEETKAPFVTSEAWQLLDAHVGNLLRRHADLEALLDKLFAIPIVSLIALEQRGVSAAYDERTRVAASYRVALFAVALLLFAFSAWKVVQVRGYLALIENANATLEERVAERTHELSEANAALQRGSREREQVESQLRLAQKLESIGQLAAGIAHEINTPVQYVGDNLTFIGSAWEDLRPVLAHYDESLLGTTAAADGRARQIWTAADVDYLGAEMPLALEQAHAGLQQISKIVHAMKECSHPGQDTPEPADINRAIETTITVARNEWKYVAEVHVSLDESLKNVPCNVSIFNQAILNILVKAAQAIGAHVPSGEKGSVWIATKRFAAHAEIRIQDDGPGVPEAIREQIFDPFFTTKDVGKGTGQGLAIAYRVICHQHHGALFTEPRPGGGARFVIRLPLSPASGEGEEISAAQTAA